MRYTLFRESIQPYFHCNEIVLNFKLMVERVLDLEPGTSKSELKLRTLNFKLEVFLFSPLNLNY
jgi:hypothetical protein